MKQLIAETPWAPLRLQASATARTSQSFSSTLMQSCCTDRASPGARSVVRSRRRTSGSLHPQAMLPTSDESDAEQESQPEPAADSDRPISVVKRGAALRLD